MPEFSDKIYCRKYPTQNFPTKNSWWVVKSELKILEKQKYGGQYKPIGPHGTYSSKEGILKKCKGIFTRDHVDICNNAFT